jgi:hypothetical protein
VVGGGRPANPDPESAGSQSRGLLRLALRLPMPGRFGEPPTCWGFSLPLPPQQHAPWTLTSRPGDGPCRRSSSNLALGAVARASCQRRRYARWAEPKREADAGERGVACGNDVPSTPTASSVSAPCPQSRRWRSVWASALRAMRTQDSVTTEARRPGLHWRSLPWGTTGHPGHLHGRSSLGPEDCTVDASSLGWAGAKGRRPNADAISVRRRATV